MEKFIEQLLFNLNLQEIHAFLLFPNQQNKGGIPMYKLEKAEIKDLDICEKIIIGGREFQREQGFVQWTEDYPNRDIIKKDMEIGLGYVIKKDNEIAAYMCIDFSGEPAYKNIKGKWNGDEVYAVVHRMAFNSSFRGIGLTSIAFSLIEKLCKEKGVNYMRIDTDFPNKRMQHILEKYGFKYCGIIVFQGGEKLAYDKLF